MSLRQLIRGSPLGPLARHVSTYVAAHRFRNSNDYWQHRYTDGGTSGSGSYGRLAQFKADVLNAFVRECGISSVVEHGCGDGAQLALAAYPTYLGLDVSPVAIELCRTRFAGDETKSFALVGERDPADHQLALSLDVIYHLVEDDVFERYLSAVFDPRRSYVAVYSSDTTEPTAVPHVRHRKFTDWVAARRPDWNLMRLTANKYPFDSEHEDETSFANFYFFRRPATSAT